jgi:hypothetical protein
LRTLQSGAAQLPPGRGYFGRIFRYFSKSSKAAAFDISLKFFDIFSKERLVAEAIFATAIRSADMHTVAAMHSQSGRLPTIVTQRSRIEGVAIFGVRVAILATTAGWETRRSDHWWIVYLGAVLIYFRHLDNRPFSQPCSRLR